MNEFNIYKKCKQNRKNDIFHAIESGLHTMHIRTDHVRQKQIHIFLFSIIFSMNCLITSGADVFAHERH